MENASYTALTRQAGLLREMAQVANNIANLSTTGYRQEGMVFSEFVRDVGPGEPSLSMATPGARIISPVQGALTETGGRFDFAIEGEGYFLIATPEGERLTRAGAFARSPAGEIVTPDGHFLLDAGGAPVFVPPGARTVSLAADGTLSANGAALAQIGLWQPVDPLDLTRRAGVMFAAPAGVEPVLDGGVMLQGFLEGSNVNPVAEIARMIEVQRAYELGQGFLDREDERIRAVLRAVAAR